MSFTPYVLMAYYKFAKSAISGYDSMLDSLSHKRLIEKKADCISLLKCIEDESNNVGKSEFSQTQITVFPPDVGKSEYSKKIIQDLTDYITQIDSYLAKPKLTSECFTCEKVLSLDHFKEEGNDYYREHDIALTSRLYSIQCKKCHRKLPIYEFSYHERDPKDCNDVIVSIINLTDSYSASLKFVSHKFLKRRLQSCQILLEKGEPIISSEIDKLEKESINQQSIETMKKAIEDLKNYIATIQKKLEKPNPLRKCIDCNLKLTLDNFEKITNSYYSSHDLKNCVCEYEWCCYKCNSLHVEKEIVKEEKKEQKKFTGCHYEHKGGCNSHPYNCSVCHVKFCSTHQNHQHQQKCSNSYCKGIVTKNYTHNLCDGCFSLYVHINVLKKK